MIHWHGNYDYDISWLDNNIAEALYYDFFANEHYDSRRTWTTLCLLVQRSVWGSSIAMLGKEQMRSIQSFVTFVEIEDADELRKHALFT